MTAMPHDLPFPPLPHGWSYGFSNTSNKYYFWRSGSQADFHHPSTGQQYEGERRAREPEKKPEAPSLIGFTETILMQAVDAVHMLEPPTVTAIVSTLGRPVCPTHEANVAAAEEHFRQLSTKLNAAPVTKGLSRIQNASTNELVALCIALGLEPALDASKESLIASLTAHSKKRPLTKKASVVRKPQEKRPMPFPPLPPDWNYNSSRTTGKYYFWKRGSELSDYRHPITGQTYEVQPDDPVSRVQRGSEVPAPQPVEPPKPVVIPVVEDHNHTTEAATLMAMGWEEEQVEEVLRKAHGDLNVAKNELYLRDKELAASPERAVLPPTHRDPAKPPEASSAMDKVRELKRLNVLFHQGKFSWEEYHQKWMELFKEAKDKDMPRRRPTADATSPHSGGPSGFPVPPPASSPPSVVPQPLSSYSSSLPTVYDVAHPDPAPHLRRGVSMWPHPPPLPLCLYTPPPLAGGAVMSPADGEVATKYSYCFTTKQWNSTTIRVRIDAYPFQEGTLRVVFHMKDLTQPEGPPQDFVAKISKTPDEPNQSYFLDCEMQALAAWFAEEYNKLNPPKLTEFVEASVIECHSRFSATGKPVVFAIEPFIHGEYIKHTNNYGWIHPQDRNTPQAFSHFTHYLSHGMILVADIQGVSDPHMDHYTDPQIHTRGNLGFGKGNLGGDGIGQFFATHQCNSICKALKLPSKQLKQVDYGTVVRAKPGGEFAMPGDPEFVPPPPNPLLLQFALSQQQVDHVEARRKALEAMATGGTKL